MLNYFTFKKRFTLNDKGINILRRVLKMNKYSAGYNVWYFYDISLLLLIMFQAMFFF